VERIAVYGKGGIGKSVVATGLSTHYALAGRKVLHVGCDPKRDSCLRIIGRPAPRTAVDLVGMEPGTVSAARLLCEGRHGIMCIESGGPDPGVGCGGRGVARAIELICETEILETGGFDVAVFDVLGDVVCGGFAAPLRLGVAAKVVIVVSEEPMALFAANNIAKAVVTYAPNGVSLAGLVANLRGGDAAVVERFAARIGTRVLASLERDPAVLEAERRCTTVLDHAPCGATADRIRDLGEALGQVDPARVPVPQPLAEEGLFALFL